MPRVSIGVPVYNGENYLEGALACLTEQSLRDIEIVVCDNASEDRTGEIARSFADRDARVRYVRNRENLGAAPNFNLCFRLTTAPYFKWAAHDDLCAPDYLERCVEVLDRDPSVVLCHADAAIIDSDGERVDGHRHHELVPAGVDSGDAAVRFRDLVLVPHYCLDVFGVIRRSALEDTPLIAAFPGSDRNLLAELGLKGRFHRVPETLFFSREHPARSIRSLEDLGERQAWFDTKAGRGPRFPHWRQLWEYLRSVRRARLPVRSRLVCGYQVLRKLRWHRGLYLDELRVGTRDALRPRGARPRRRAGRTPGADEGRLGSRSR